MPNPPIGLTEEIVRRISTAKHEPDWMLDIRLQAYQDFLRLPMPNFGPDLSEINFDNLTFFDNNTNPSVDRWDEIPADIKLIYDKIGLPEAEQRYLAGAQVQNNSAVLYTKLKEQWQKLGVIFTDTDTAVQKYPDLVRQYFGQIVSANSNKFAALNTAVWSGGSFIYVPPGVRLPIPLQAYYRISIANLGQFERSLIIVDKDASLHYVEGCSAPIYQDCSLHAAVVEVIARANAHVRYTTVQNWSTSIYNIINQRMVVESNGVGEWVGCNVGAKATIAYPTIVLSEPGARGDILSLSTAGDGQVQDSGGKILHLAPQTKSTITSKSLVSGNGVSNYRGLVAIDAEAHNCQATTKCDSILLGDNSSTNNYPQMQVDNPSAVVHHEATAGQVDQAQLFYLTSRGLSQADALQLIVNGFVEPVVGELPMEYAVELNDLIRLNTEGAIG